MQIIATQYTTRQSSRKVRLVANSVKSLPLSDVIPQLGLVERRSSEVILKVLRQALANAQHNHGLGMKDLKLVSILVMDGPSYRRYRPVSRGRAHDILKRTCHVRVVLETIDSTKSVVTKQAAPAKPTVVAEGSQDKTENESVAIQKALAEKKQPLAKPKTVAKRRHQRKTGV